jgi:hypothetical protein
MEITFFLLHHENYSSLSALFLNGFMELSPASVLFQGENVGKPTTEYNSG